MVRTFDPGDGGGTTDDPDDDSSGGSNDTDTTSTSSTSTTSSSTTRTRDTRQLRRLQEDIEEQETKAEETQDATDTEQSAGRDSGVARSDPRPNKDTSEPVDQATQNKQRAVADLKNTEPTRSEPTDSEPTRRRGPQRGTDRAEPGGVDTSDLGTRFDQRVRAGGATAASIAGAAVNRSTTSINENVDFVRTPGGEVRFIVGDETEGTRRLREQGTEVSFEEALQAEFTTPDVEVVQSLTKADGVLSDEEEQSQLERAQAIREGPLNISEETRELVAEHTGSEIVANFAAGASRLPSELAAASREGLVLADKAVEAGQAAPETIEDHGLQATLQATGETVGLAGSAVAEEAAENPAEFTGEVAAGAVLGTAAFKGLEKAGDVRTTAGTLRRADRRPVDIRDITTERGASGQITRFETDTDAPTRKAVDEIEREAKDTPSGIRPGDSEGATFHTTQSDFPTDLTVEEGASELPGLFTSPKASGIGLRGETAGGLSSFRPRLPRIGGQKERVVSLPVDSDDVRAMPPSAKGSGYELRTPDGDVIDEGLSRGQAKSRAASMDSDVEVRPQQSTSGYQFLTEEADTDAFYVRPTGSRTPEMEAISPPGSQFVDEGITPVRVGSRTFPGTDIRIPGSGRLIPGQRFRRRDADADIDGDDVNVDATDVDGDDVTAAVDVDSLPGTYVSGRPGSTAVGGAVTGAGAGAVVGASTTTGGGSSTSGVEATGGTGTTSPGSPTGGSPTGSGPSGTGTDTPPPSGDPTTPTGSPTGVSPTGGGGSSGGGGSGTGSPTGGSPTGSGSPTGTPTGVPGTPSSPSPTPVPKPESESKRSEPGEDPWWLEDDEFDTGLSDVEDLENEEFEPVNWDEF